MRSENSTINIALRAALFLAALLQIVLCLLPLFWGERCCYGQAAVLPLGLAALFAAKPKGHRAWRVLGFLCIVWMILSLLLFGGMKICAMSAPSDTDEISAILVPGCSVTEQGLSDMCRRRCDKALELAKRYPNALVIVSGAQLEGESETEAGAMRRYLLSQGIADSRIVCDEQATSTADNIEAAKAAINGGKIAVCSDDFHLLRIMLLAGQKGVDITPVCSSESSARSLCYWYREQPAIIRALLLGY